MNRKYIVPNSWSIIEEGFDARRVESSESLFSLGNGFMGQRANFEETYSGESLQGSYIGGVYYPDKTKVGWWKNGYPEFFAKVLNAPNWIGIDVEINGENLDLSNCTKVENFRRELNMKEGLYYRSFEAELKNKTKIEVKVTRFISMNMNELGVVNYQIIPLNEDSEIIFKPYLDGGIRNKDANWEEKFWETLQIGGEDNFAFIKSQTLKTLYKVATYMHNSIFKNDENTNAKPFEVEESAEKIQFKYRVKAKKGEKISIQKLGGYVTSLNHSKEKLAEIAKETTNIALQKNYETLVQNQKDAWGEIWKMSDIVIKGDTKAQQAIRFNIFHLNQTYTGKDAGLNIGPKGFTGEKYGGSTYWDTEAYCLPFYMATKESKVARNLLVYRYNHLEKAIENAEKLGFKNGAALYPMVTMNGEESHNEWEITFEEIHRNGAIAFAIYNYTRYTGDQTYIAEKGLEVLIAIARFWSQRVNFSDEKNKYVILGVTGPNEYENNVNNNFHTNYIAKWCLNYALEQIQKVKENYHADYKRIKLKTKLNFEELESWKNIADNLYFPYSEKLEIYLQQDGFLDKELSTILDLEKHERPLNQHWSWDRILRSPYIKQADTLQTFYFFEEHFSKEELRKHFDFYEAFTVHESSLSPCVHSVLASSLNKTEKAYELYLQTSRLDLDDYNREVKEGLHITSMAGTWMSIVEGFGGMRIKNGELNFNPIIPKKWNKYSFKINFRNRILKVIVSEENTKIELEKGESLEVYVNGQKIILN